MICLNLSCNRKLEARREGKRDSHIGRFWFCTYCMKYESGVLEWKCFRGDCDNRIRWNVRLPRKYCSDICRMRHREGVAVKRLKICEFCGNDFWPRRFAKQRFCSRKCNDRFSQERRKLERRTA